MSNPHTYSPSEARILSSDRREITRRGFLASTAMIVAGFAVGSSRASAEQPKDIEPQNINQPHNGGNTMKMVLSA